MYSSLLHQSFLEANLSGHTYKLQRDILCANGPCSQVPEQRGAERNQARGPLCHLPGKGPSVQLSCERLAVLCVPQAPEVTAIGSRDCSRQCLSAPGTAPTLASPPFITSSQTPCCPQEKAGCPTGFRWPWRSPSHGAPAKREQHVGAGACLLTRVPAVGVPRKLGGVGDGPLCFPGEK